MPKLSVCNDLPVIVAAVLLGQIEERRAHHLRDRQLCSFPDNRAASKSAGATWRHISVSTPPGLRALTATEWGRNSSGE